MNNSKLKKIVLAISLIAMAPIVSAAEIFDPNEQLAHGKEMVDSQNLKEKRKLDLEIAILNNEIKNIDGTNQKSIEEAVEKARSDIEKQYQLQIRSLQKQVKDLEAKNKSLEGQFGTSGEKAEDIFYTGLIQIGTVKKAEVISGGSRSLIAIGESVAPGIVVTGIESDRLVVRSGAGTRSFPIKSSAQIADKLYEAAVEKARSSREAGGGLTQALKLPDDFKISESSRRD